MPRIGQMIVLPNAAVKYTGLASQMKSVPSLGNTPGKHQEQTAHAAFPSSV